MPLPSNKLFTPGFRLIADKIGSYIDFRNYIRLGNYLTLADNTADPSAVIDVDTAAIVGLFPGNSGTTAGRENRPVQIDRQVLSAQAAYTSASFVAETYKELILKADGVQGTAGFANMSLTGLSGAANGYVKTNTATVNNIGVAATIWVFGGAAAVDVNSITNIFPLNTGRRRKFHGHAVSIASSTTWANDVYGDFDDTTHGVTAVTLSMDTFTGTIELWGIPA